MIGKRDTGNGKRELLFGPILRSKPTCRRSECLTFRDVGGYGDGRTLDLIDQGEMPMQGRPYREHVGSRGEVLAGSPSVQGLNLSHGVKVSDPGSGIRSRMSRREAFFRDTCPVSRVPCPVPYV